MLFVSAGFFFTIKKGTRQNKQNIFFWFKSRTSRSLFSRVHAYIFSYTVTKKKNLYYFMNKKSKEYTEMIEFSIDCRYFGFCNI